MSKFTDALAKVWRWITGAYPTEVAAHAPPVAPIAVIEPPSQPPIESNVLLLRTKVKAQRRGRRKGIDDPAARETLGNLLDSIHATFAALKLPTSELSWLESDTAIGLKKLGAYVPDAWFTDEQREVTTIAAGTSLPSLMCLAEGSERADAANTNKDTVYPSIMFAVRCKSLPWYVTKKPGVPFRFGYAYRMTVSATATVKKLTWLHLYLTVENGQIHICDELHKNIVSISGSSYCRQEWETPALLQHHRIIGEEARKLTSASFSWMVNQWNSRGDRWSVAISKAGERLTFSVPPSRTKMYFANRDKTVKAADGRAKRIIHYVNEHERDIGEKITTVKAHIRGIDAFEWEGFKCSVKAPEFHGALLSTVFSLTPSVDAEEDLPISVGTIAMSKLGKMLADEDDRKDRAA